MLCIIAIVKGAIWGAIAVEPVIQMLGLGSVFAAWNMAKISKTFNDHIFKSEEPDLSDPTAPTVLGSD